MNPISTVELASIQTEAAIALDQTCVIQRNTTGKDAWGTETEAPTTVVTTMAGMTQPSALLLANYAYAIGSLATWHVRLPNNTDVRRQDTLLIGGQKLEVQILLTPQSYSVFTNVLASEVKG